MNKNQDEIFRESNFKLLSMLPKEKLNEIFFECLGDIGPEFLGFVHIYERLSEIIPHHFTVIDLGCAYNPQCYFFKNHKKYIAVDISNCKKFKTNNCVIYNKDIVLFIKDDLPRLKLDMDETFVICSYVTSKDFIIEIIKQTFHNLFIYYPSNKKERVSLTL